VPGSTTLNDNPPASIKEVVVTRRGYQAFAVYFTLADSSGAQTTAEGGAVMLIEAAEPGLEPTLMTATRDIHKTSFIKAKVGEGSSAREDILFSFGLMNYEQNFIRKPTIETGEVTVTFTTNGQDLVGKATIKFDQ
jgi:hypothetical protein